jgi:hypothetical protein
VAAEAEAEGEVARHQAAAAAAAAAALLQPDLHQDAADAEEIQGEDVQQGIQRDYCRALETV